jgi:hypothetical protein
VLADTVVDPITSGKSILQLLAAGAKLHCETLNCSFPLSALGVERLLSAAAVDPAVEGVLAMSPILGGWSPRGLIANLVPSTFLAELELLGIIGTAEELDGYDLLSKPVGQLRTLQLVSFLVFAVEGNSNCCGRCGGEVVILEDEPTPVFSFARGISWAGTVLAGLADLGVDIALMFAAAVAAAWMDLSERSAGRGSESAEPGKLRRAAGPRSARAAAS